MEPPFNVRPEFSTRFFAAEVCVRIFLLLVFLKLELTEPFVREIQPEEAWLYSYPRTDSYVPSSALWFLVWAVPVVTIGACFLINKDWIDLRESGLCVSLALLLNGIITNSVKLAVGRPRPDFVTRCHPEGGSVSSPCTGDSQTLADGRKSFPSGHSSFSWCLAMFVFLYLSGKLGTFTDRGRRQSHKLLVLLPLLIASLIAISRTCDYHHHWQDVAVGTSLGAAVAWVSYQHFYPSVFDTNCDRPLCIAGIDTAVLPQVTTDIPKPAPTSGEVKWM